MTSVNPQPFVSRAGLKLDHALREFNIDVNGWVCADFGCNIGGFTDCLLQRGAAKVFAIDTGYGTLAYKLRIDPRVVVMERTNALHVQPLTEAQSPGTPVPGTEVPKPSTQAAGADLVVIDLAWTQQRLSIPAALKWLKPGGILITLVKPHYELFEDEKKLLLVDGRLNHAEAERVFQRMLQAMPALGATPLAHVRSPITGGKSSRGSASGTGAGTGAGNIEFLVLAEPAST